MYIFIILFYTRIFSVSTLDTVVSLLNYLLCPAPSSAAPPIHSQLCSSLRNPQTPVENAVTRSLAGRTCGRGSLLLPPLLQCLSLSLSLSQLVLLTPVLAESLGLRPFAEILQFTSSCHTIMVQVTEMACRTNTWLAMWMLLAVALSATSPASALLGIPDFLELGDCAKVVLKENFDPVKVSANKNDKNVTLKDK